MPAYKRKLSKGDRWRYAGQYLGTPYCSKSIYLTKSEAQKAERLKIAQLDEEARRPKNEMTLQTLINHRLDFIQATKSKDYYKENRRYFKLILGQWGDVQVNAITKAMVNALLMEEHRRLKKAGRSNYKVNSLLRALKALFNYGNRVFDLDVKNPCNFDFYPIDIHLKYIPPNEDIEAVKATCNPIQKLFFEFVEQTGCRVMEAVRFRYEDIDGDLITLWTRKARNSNLTPRRIPKPLCLNGLAGHGRVFPYSKLPRFLDRKVKRLGQKTWSWHSLRHRYASKLASSGVSLFHIQNLLGHSNIQITQRYCQLLGYTGL